MAVPPRPPGYQASTMLLTLEAQGVRTGPPVSRTTTVLGLAAATALTRASWSPSLPSPHLRLRQGTSASSARASETNTTATLAALATLTAAATLEPSA